MSRASDHRAVFDLESTVKDWDDDYYHPVAERYYDEAVPWMLSAMGATRGSKVVDAGCGPGVHAIRAARVGCRVTALDISPTMLSHACTRASAAGVVGNIAFQKANLVDFKLAEPAPFVFSWGVVIHIPEIDEVLDCLAAAVAPGGSLGLHILGRGSLDFGIERLARKILRKPWSEPETRPLGFGNWYIQNGERLWVMRFDMPALIAAMEARGFQLKARRGAEFSEFQRRFSGWPRTALLYLNSLAWKLRLPSGLFATQIVVFEKTG